MIIETQLAQKVMVTNLVMSSLFCLQISSAWVNKQSSEFSHSDRSRWLQTDKTVATFLGSRMILYLRRI